MKKLNLFLVLSLCFVYLEVVFKLIFNYALTISTFIYPIAFALFLYLIIKSFRIKNEVRIFYSVLAIVTFLFGVQLCMYRMYNFYFDFGLLAAADQIGAFYKDIIKLIISNIGSILLLIIPFTLCVIFRTKIDFIRSQFKLKLLIVPTLILLVFIIFYTPKNISTDVSVINNGVIGTFINNFKEKEEVELINQDDIVIEEEVVEEEVYVPQYHTYNIDFDSAKSDNSSIQKLNDYFSSSTGTLENEYTGLFKDKNLILIMGESFNEMAVREDLTPNLYMMMKEGLEFTNYYSTSYNSTVGGEFQLLTGMYAMSDALERWKQGTNYFPMGPATLFEKNGYSVHAYHDHAHTYMNRDQYLKSVGFDNYVGCGNGFEEHIACYIMFEEDSAMPELTVDDYINEDKFFTYYVTVSGHGPYTFDTSSNTIGSLHKDEIYEKGYEYNEKNTAYISGMIELDNMLGELIKSLKAAGKFDDTVFVIAADHYPYYLNTEDIKELTGEDREEVVGVCENSLIIYNSRTPKIRCDKAGNTMDVIATIYNLFGIDYDSRLIVGKDLLSNAPGFALFGNGSWASDYGIYYAHLGEFVPYEGVEVPEDYFTNANSYAQSQIAMTNLIVLNDYYKYIWDYKK